MRSLLHLYITISLVVGPVLISNGQGPGPTLDPVPVRYNTVEVVAIKKPGVKTANDLSVLSVNSKLAQRAYLDGLGRDIATISVRGSATQLDLVQLYSYDDLGRTDSLYLPYVNNTTSGAFSNRKSMVKAQLGFYSTAGDFIEDSGAPFGVSVFDPSPLGYLKEQGGPGADWQPGTHTVTRKHYLNVSNEIRIWKEDFTSTVFYSPSEVMIEEAKDENGNLSKIYTDKAGKILEKRIQISNTVWARTLFIYTLKGQLKAIVQPEGVKILGTASTIPSSVTDHHAFLFTYDSQGRLVEKKVPGVAPIYYAYDPLGRLALIQDGNQRASNKWIFIKYDRDGRQIIQGFYTNATHITRSAIQQNVLNALPYLTGETFYEKRVTAGTHGYTNQSFPTTGTEITSVQYFDSYDLDGNGTDFSYTTQNLTHTTTEGEMLIEGVQAATVGKVTATKVNILGTANWITSYIFYDAKGNVIQVRKNNHLSLTADNLVTNLIDFSGKVWLSKRYHKTSASNIITIINRYEYDAAGRLLKVFQKNNSDAEQQMATYKYNALGQLIDKKLHGTEATALQSVDYRYNIRGWLTSINNSQLTNDNIRNDDANDLFGMELLYNQAEVGLNTDVGDSLNWNGNISAVKWKGGMTSGLANQRGYKFKYDKHNRLKSAVFRQVDISSWSTSLNALNESMTYDHNGNIKTLQRNDRKHEIIGVDAFYSSKQVDNLTYLYTSAGNQLNQINDTAPNAGGFANGVNAGVDFGYDAAGNLTTDQNKGITAITYNLLGKVQQVTLPNSGTIQYVYDASGSKLKMTVTKGGTTVVTDYVDGFVYLNTALQFFSAPEGRVVKNGSAYEYEYAISDHQGNTRLVFTSATIVPVTPEANFEGIGSDSTSRYKNVNIANVVTSLAANHTPSGSKVLRMNQTYKIGPSKSVKVYPGDKIDMEVWEYHEGTSGFGTSTTPLATMITMVSSAFGGVSGGAGESGAIHNGVNGALTAFGKGGNAGAAQPAAYLNFIMFDKYYNILDAGWQIVPATTFTKQKVSIPTKHITEEGYMFVYLSYDNDSPNWVYFDDFKVTHTKSRVIQYNEYYPFGLQTSNSWTRTGTRNDYLYNSANELNMTTGWYETFFRGYDPAIGRFLQVDPMATRDESFSPYHYVRNNPGLLNDPLGLSVGIDWKTLSNIIENLFSSSHGGSWSKKSYDKSDGGSCPGCSYFDSSDDAFDAASDYNDKHNSWGQTYYGNRRDSKYVHGKLKAGVNPIYYKYIFTRQTENGNNVSFRYTQQGGPSITGAVINTGMLSGENNCANCGYLKNGLGTNVRPDLGYFNGVEVQFNISGNLKGYKVSVTRTKTFIDARNGVAFDSGTNRDDGPASGNVQLVNGKIYSIDMPGFTYGSITAGTLSRDMIGHFTETATIQDGNGNIVSQFSVQWQSTIQISRSSPDGAFIFTGSIGPR